MKMKTYIWSAIGIIVACGLIIMALWLGLYLSQKGEYSYKTEQGSFGAAERCYTIRGELLCDSGNKTIKVVEYERIDK